MLRAIPTFSGNFGLRDAARQLAATIAEWQERTVMREHLASLDDRILADIGLTRIEVDFETRKPFWRA